MISLKISERDYILEQFEKHETSTAHSNVWKRRSYAPMYIYSDELSSIQNHVSALFPEYKIVFDVIFDSDGSEVAWHCDYESLGPFCVPDRLKAIKNKNFLSIHFNLTEEGGHLETFNFVYLSYIHYLIIAYFGIFTLIHSFILTLSLPIFYVFSEKKVNTALVGNVFDNTRLHKVSAGKPRTSYVLRLVRNSYITRKSVIDGVSRSTACHAFRPLLNLFDNDQEVISVENIDWKHIFK